MSEETITPPIEGPPSTDKSTEAPPVDKTEKPVDKTEKPVVEEKPKAKKFETEKKAFVRYKGKMSGLSHNGSEGASYFFSRKQWTPINKVDEGNYERKAAKNPQNWEIKFEDALIYKDIHTIMFKGSKAYPIAIDLVFDDEKKEKTRKFVFKKGEWVIVPEDIAKTMSDKALSSPLVWAYQVDKVPVKKK